MNASEPAFNCADQAQDSWWDRATRACELVKPHLVASPGVRVADVGCGDLKFEQAIEQSGLHVAYFPYDLNPQSDRVTAFDANLENLPARADVLVMLGVTEYLHDLPATLCRFATSARLAVLSHVVSEASTHTPERVAQLGWRNHLSSHEFQTLCERSGWQSLESRMTANGRTRIWLLRSVSSETQGL